MKRNKILKLASILTFTLCLSCGSTEKVIATDGTVYELKGNKFYTGGQEVTSSLSSEEKTELKEILEQRQAFAIEAEKKQEELEKAQDKAEEARKKAEDKQKELEDKIEAKKDARKEFFKAEKKLSKEKAKYQKKLDRGDLSPNDIEDWKETLKELEEEVQEAEQRLKRF